MAVRVNLGCGVRFHPDWVNIDLAPQADGVIAHDLREGIPLADASCDAVYHAAVLEHIPPREAPGFVRECHRVLKPGGILRVVVPDLEQICRVYLEKLEAVLRGDAGSEADYDWIMLELYDQGVRTRPGGEMRAYLEQDPLPNRDFVYERIGEEGRSLVRALRASETVTLEPRAPRSWRARVSVPGARRAARRLRPRVARARDRIVGRLLLGQAGLRALEIGRFRLGGEVHQWMYDRYSLARLLCMAGFENPVPQSMTTSMIDEWSRFHLDALPDGTAIKPDSFYTEAVKPRVDYT